ncbi:MAG: type IV secretion system DNA-binding domain-containing protein [Hydrogenothermaceae bacterium]
MVITKNRVRFKDIKTITEHQKPPIYASNLDLTKSTLVVGKMGTGKSVFLKNLLAQEKYNRAIINDVKGEYVEAFYNPEKDIIFQPFDARSKLWFFFEDIKQEPTLADVISTAMVSQISETNKDFWITAAQKLLKDAILYSSFSEQPNKHNAILEYIQTYQKQAIQVNDKTALSIVATLQPILDYFELAGYLEDKYLREEKYDKFFTLFDFVNTDNKQKLFLLNDVAHRTATAPFQTAFLSALISLLLSRPNTKEDFTFFLLDEFLSIKIPEDLLILLFTTARSKGIQLLFATQFLPNVQNDKRTQIILSSRQLTILFKVVDETTLSTIENTMGDFEFITSTTNTSTSRTVATSSSISNGSLSTGFPFGKTATVKSTSTSTSFRRSYSEDTEMQRATKRLIDRSYILALPEYHALVHLTDPFQIFLAKVENFYFDFHQKKAEAFERLDLSEFYQSKARMPHKYYEEQQQNYIRQQQEYQRQQQ